MAEKMFLDRGAILGALDIETEEVYVPEWRGWVRVRGLMGYERDAFEAELVRLRGPRGEVLMHNVRAKLVARSVVDEVGNRLFTDADIEALGQKSAAALDRIFEVAQRLSGVTKQAVEELAGNFGSGQTGGSTSA